MTRFKARVGPKGQVVIPKPLRDEYQIPPGTPLVIEDRAEGIYIKKPVVNLGDLFEEIAKTAKVRKDYQYDPHKAHDAEMRERLKDVLRRR